MSQAPPFEGERVFSVRDGILAMLDRAGWRPHVPDEVLHAARKKMKKIRGGLRLVRPAVGDPVYRRANGWIRDAARPLSGARDAVILLNTLSRLRHRKDPEDTRRFYACLEQLLRRKRIEARERLTADAAREAQHRLSAARAMLRQSAAQTSEIRGALPGIRKVYRAGRAAMSHAQMRPGGGSLHEWRKQVKYLENELQLARALYPVKFGKIRRRLQKLAELLGEDHDLLLLHEAIVRHADDAGLPQPPTALTRRIERRRRRLSAKFRSLGERLYERRPRRFESWLRKKLTSR